jgi:hypothetical protein
MRLSNNPASANKCKSTAYEPMAVQHRGVEGASVVEMAVDEEEDDEGKEQMPNGILSRLKSELGGISIQDFILLVAFYSLALLKWRLLCASAFICGCALFRAA